MRLKNEEAKAEIQMAWKQWDGDKTNILSMITFYGWLEENRPELLKFRSYGDPWQTVNCWLQEYEDKKKYI